MWTEIVALRAWGIAVDHRSLGIELAVEKVGRAVGAAVELGVQGLHEGGERIEPLERLDPLGEGDADVVVEAGAEELVVLGVDPPHIGEQRLLDLELVLGRGRVLHRLPYFAV